MAKTIKILETFSGIGAQNKAITNINSQRGKKIFDIVATADWDARANISYSAIHHDLNSKYEEILIKNSLVTEHDINVFLNKFNISLNSKSGSRIKSKNLLFKKYLAASILLSDNQVDITKLNPNILKEKDIDLVTYSFPCQGLSVANMGRAKGINDNESTSSLVWQIYRILSNSNKKPKYLIMENVKNLLSKKFAPEYEKWKGVLSELGYKTFTTIINGIDAGSIQKRERVFALSVLKDVYTPFNNDEEFKKYIDSKNETRKLDLEGRKKYFNKVFDFDLNSKDNISVLINDTPSRVKMINSQKIINESSNFIINTLTTKQDRIPCTGVIKHENNLIGKLNYRFITPKEAFMLMGFAENDFNKIRPLYEKNILTKDSLYRQAGNSIVVESITSVFNVIEDIESLGEENGQK
ncbi:Cytosine-specific methyltransferase [Mycoplasmopsis canis PG 14]|uniref:Cytosine-specific methyltransferase n=1 Tax=Mycoplasmopsis canis TaxID=29555 RepID=A0A449AQX1_9BACT|nr:DNA (cytosine-5-)-methyltransferase [Mycoplasmopsis canis]AMD81112.1 CpG DNA methylase [Mycoplasmopsis canis PG 14]EIE39822.1 Cytosine-specific methyltransferase [Mycoplasmopsis canis PG 14]VEU68933.1 Cytosine-specific DNA methyltransferase/Type II site-specific deoxyribonuclease [Mycoplasmopsis canis]